MLRSNNSNIIAINRLVEKFNDENVTLFKKQLFQELGIDKESQFITKILPIIHKSLLTSESIEKLKCDAIKIAEKQMVDVSPTHAKQSLYKTIQ